MGKIGRKMANGQLLFQALVLMDSDSTSIFIRLMFCCTIQYRLCHQTLFSTITKKSGKKRSSSATTLSFFLIVLHLGVYDVELCIVCSNHIVATIDDSVNATMNIFTATTGLTPKFKVGTKHISLVNFQPHVCLVLTG